MERKRRISAPFLRTGLNNYRQSKTAAQPENTIIALIQAGIADNIFSPIIPWISHGSYRLFNFPVPVNGQEVKELPLESGTTLDLCGIHG